jgi:hypothetical protein
MIHMEHCVFLTPGTDKTNRERHCNHHDVKFEECTGVVSRFPFTLRSLLRPDSLVGS